MKAETEQTEIMKGMKEGKTRRDNEAKTTHATLTKNEARHT